MMRKVVIGVVLLGLVIYGLEMVNDFYIGWKYEKVTQRLREKRESMASVDYFKTRPLLVFSTGSATEVINQVWLYDWESDRVVESSWGKLEGIDLFKGNGIKEMEKDTKQMIEEMFEPQKVSISVWEPNSDVAIVTLWDGKQNVSEIYRIDVKSKKRPCFIGVI